MTSDGKSGVEGGCLFLLGGDWKFHALCVPWPMEEKESYVC
jgi:hypothetical protein